MFGNSSLCETPFTSSSGTKSKKRVVWVPIIVDQAQNWVLVNTTPLKK